MLIIEGEKIYSANSFGNKDKALLVIDGNKIYSANSFGNKDKVRLIIEGGYNLTELVAVINKAGII